MHIFKILDKHKSWHATNIRYRNIKIKKSKTHNERKYRRTMKAFALYTVYKVVGHLNDCNNNFKGKL